MPQLLIKNSGKKHLKKNFKKFDNSLINYLKKIPKGATVLITDYIYPLKNLRDKTVEISDHVNLSGFNPLKGAKFIPLSNIYLSKKGIIIAGLEKGTHPNIMEKKVLLKCNVQAYCYNIVPTVIYATYLGLKIKTLGIVKDIHI